MLPPAYIAAAIIAAVLAVIGLGFWLHIHLERRKERAERERRDAEAAQDAARRDYFRQKLEAFNDI